MGRPRARSRWRAGVAGLLCLVLAETAAAGDASERSGDVLTLHPAAARAWSIEKLRQAKLLQTRGSEGSRDYALIVHLSVAFRDPAFNRDALLLRSLQSARLDERPDAQTDDPPQTLERVDEGAGAHLEGTVFKGYDTRWTTSRQFSLRIGPRQFPIDLASIHWTPAAYVQAPASAHLQLAQLQAIVELGDPDWLLLRDAKWRGGTDATHPLLEVTIENQSSAPRTVAVINILALQDNKFPVACIHIPFGTPLAMLLLAERSTSTDGDHWTERGASRVAGSGRLQPLCEGPTHLNLAIAVGQTIEPKSRVRWQLAYGGPADADKLPRPETATARAARDAQMRELLSALGEWQSVAVSADAPADATPVFPRSRTLRGTSAAAP
jgi:hypothetical protein